jgi:hypothetical protein
VAVEIRVRLCYDSNIEYEKVSVECGVILLNAEDSQSWYTPFFTVRIFEQLEEN